MTADFRDNVWDSIRETAQAESEREPSLASFLHATILNHEHLEQSVSFHMAGRLESNYLSAMMIREVIEAALIHDINIGRAIRADICAVRERDPAVNCCLVPFLFLKGVHALIAYRIAHWVWKQDRKLFAFQLQNRISEAFGVDCHPAARIGSGILIDHATGVVIGETAVIEDNVSLLHEVTLGGTGKETGDRHPKIRQGVLIGTGAKILGNVEVGEGAKVAAGSVVLTDVPARTTVAGIPAKVVGTTASNQPALEMDHNIPDALIDGSGI